MKRQHCVRFAAATLLGTVALSQAERAQAQSTSAGVGNPRTTNERVVTQTPTPPPVNSDARRAADGLPPLGGTLPADRGDIDPALRIEPGTRAGLAEYPAGMDVAMLVEHSLGMAIEASSLKALAERSMSGPDGSNAMTKRLLDVATRQVDESKKLMSRAASDGGAVPANSPARRFYAAASLYLTNLNSLGALSAADQAQVALINHAVKDTLDADHISRMGRSVAGSHALAQLLSHAQAMKTEGTEVVMREAGNGAIDPNEPPTVATLARRGREVLDAAEQLSHFYATQAVSPRAAGPNPGRLDPERPAIIGGTLGTGSRETGTYPGPVPPSPIPTPIPGGTTKGDAVSGLPPR